MMTTFLAILIPLSLLSVVVHQWGMVIIREQIEQSMLSHNAYYQQVFESEISRSQRLAESLMDDEDLLKLSSIALSLNDYERAASLNRLHDKLFSVRNSSLYIADVIAIIPDLNRVVSGESGVNPITAAEQEILGTFRMAASAGWCPPTGSSTTGCATLRAVSGKPPSHLPHPDFV
jgi:two-component system sensor histidine kinase YesM